MNDLVPMVVTFIVFYFVYQIIALFARRRERMSIIEKLGSIPSEQNCRLIEQLLQRVPRKSFGALRVSLLLIGIGIGAIVGTLLSPLFAVDIPSMNDWAINDMIIMCRLASIAIFGGLGLFISAIIESRANANIDKLQ